MPQESQSDSSRDKASDGESEGDSSDEERIHRRIHLETSEDEKEAPRFKAAKSTINLSSEEEMEMAAPLTGTEDDSIPVPTPEATKGCQEEGEDSRV